MKFYTIIGFLVLTAYLEAQTAPCNLFGSQPYHLSGYSWNKLNLKYYFKNFTPDLTQVQLRKVFQEAFNKWAAVSGLTFTETTNVSEADITMRWHTEDYFYNTTSKFAVSYYPPPYHEKSGDMEFNENITWKIEKIGDGYNDLRYVALHEIGHVLGLCHSGDALAVMYYPFSHKLELSQADIDGITKIYLANITADNNFTDNSGNGTHGTMVIDSITRTIPSSGYSITKNSGQNLSLSAVSPQTDNQGYQRIWNTGSGVLSEWQRNFARVSYNQTYSFTVSADDNGAKYQAQLRPLSGPKFVYFYQEPDPLYNGGTGYVYAVFSSEVGDITYSWLAYSNPSNITLIITPEGSRCKVHYYVPFSTNPNITLVCTARNAYGSNTNGYQLHTALYGYGPASLAVATNGVLTDENPILVSSVDNPGVDVTDYYLINKEITPENNVVKFSIHERDETKGQTYLDQVELWEIKANPNELIAVTEEGEENAADEISLEYLE